MRNKARFVYIVWKGKHYVSQCLNVDVSSFGKTKAEAIKNLEEALELYLEDTPLRAIKIGPPAIIQREFRYAQTLFFR